MTNFDETSKQTFIDILKEARIPCHASEIKFNSLGDDLGIDSVDEEDAVYELAGWLDLIYCYDELSLEEQQRTIWSCLALGARTDDWTLYVADNGWIQVALTPTLCKTAVQFDVCYKSDRVNHPDGSYTLPPTINGVIASPSMTEAIENFAADLNIQKDY